jgi:hypothetical protein
MDITPEHIAYKKRVGRIGHSPVIELATTGGLHLIVAARGGKSEVLGAGPHRAVARFIAKKKEPDIMWTELSKSDWVPVEHFADILPEYEAYVDALRARQ